MPLFGEQDRAQDLNTSKIKQNHRHELTDMNSQKSVDAEGFRIPKSTLAPPEQHADLPLKKRNYEGLMQGQEYYPGEEV